jgi:cold shock CspA family protein
MATAFDRERYSGAVTSIGRNFAFVELDGGKVPVFVHRAICEDLNFDNLVVGDRLRFCLRESKSHPGKLCAGRIAYEVKT